MMGLATIKRMSRESAEKAAAAHKEPFMMWEGDAETFPPFPFPNIGDHRPEGWELVESLFCDSSGFGSSGEAALTVEQLKERLKPGFGYAIIEEGQFQAYIGEFRKL